MIKKRLVEIEKIRAAAAIVLINLISDFCIGLDPNNLDCLNPKKDWLKGMQPLFHESLGGLHVNNFLS